MNTMIKFMRACLARRKRKAQIRQFEQYLRVLRPRLMQMREEQAQSLADVQDRLDIVLHIEKAELCLAYLRERV